MKNMLEELFLPYTSQLGMQKSEDNLYKNSGNTFYCDTEIGKGFCWIYSFDNKFSLSVYDFEIKERIRPKYDHPEFFTIGLLNESTAQYVLESTKPTGQIISYTRPEGTFCETFTKGTHANSFGLTFSPDFLKSLSRNFHFDYSFLVRSCFDLQHSCLIKDVEFILKQIFSAEPSQKCAAMYYEGKVMELLSMLIQWQAENKKYAPNEISSSDLDSLNEVIAYITKHYEKKISINDLANIAFMGRNKLSYIFKLKYGVSIMEYLRTIRIEQAKDILINTSLPIQSVSAMVGYKNQGSFAERFKMDTGMSPTEYRRLLYHSTTINIKRDSYSREVKHM
ncbi:helix-turn-helix transcriptional regulator [Clostridium sp. D2Q-14]|uniref:helix-turn-helix domain-containing protein n=1 Tax=Anaeromonas gelatinilytica TaxID=2683194 RepID=UPI00193C7B63|nr:AraC family transcriptional regulator [Anaeromonas gelatinilytica]MBS4534345.1 helix-turn-helix transcriptional regulator [Anaeromonas gelatinilytica]